MKYLHHHHADTAMIYYNISQHDWDKMQPYDKQKLFFRMEKNMDKLHKNTKEDSPLCTLMLMAIIVATIAFIMGVDDQIKINDDARGLREYCATAGASDNLCNYKVGK